MSETRAKLRTMKLSVAKETTENTAATEQATSAVLLSEDGAEFDLSRDLIEETFMSSSLSQTAPLAGMWGDDLGLTVNSLVRGKGTRTQPDYSVFMESIFGIQNQNTSGTADALSDTKTILIKTGGDPSVGQLVYFPDQSFVTRVVALSAGTSFDVWPPLPAAASEDDTFTCGTNWMLASTGHPSFTAWGYFDGPKRLRYTGCKTMTWEATFEVGAIVPMVFTCRGLTPTYDYTAQGVTPVYDTATRPLRCLGIDMFTVLTGTATGTPTQTETILLAPNFEVAIGDKIMIDVGSDVWETVAISNVSGNAGSNITLTHASVSVAASATDTVYIQRINCANIGDTISITIEMETDFERCMVATYGKVGQEMVGRTVNISKTPYFKSWQEFYMRDAVIGSALMITLGDTDNNIFSVYIPNQINTEVSITADPLMKLDVTSQAVVDETLGNDHEIVVAAF